MIGGSEEQKQHYGRGIAPYLSMAKAYATDAKQLMLVEGTSQLHRLIIHRAIKDGRINYW